MIGEIERVTLLKAETAAERLSAPPHSSLARDWNNMQDKSKKPFDAPASFCLGLHPALNELEDAMAAYEAACDQSNKFSNLIWRPQVVSTAHLLKDIERSEGDPAKLASLRVNYLSNAIAFLGRYLPWELAHGAQAALRPRLSNAIADCFIAHDSLETDAAVKPVMKARILKAAALSKKRDLSLDHLMKDVLSANIAQRAAFTSFFAALPEALKSRPYSVKLPELEAPLRYPFVALPPNPTDAEKYPNFQTLAVCIEDCAAASDFATQVACTGASALNEETLGHRLAELLIEPGKEAELVRSLKAADLQRSNDEAVRQALDYSIRQLNKAINKLVAAQAAAAAEIARRIKFLSPSHWDFHNRSLIQAINNCLTANSLLAQWTKQVQDLEIRYNTEWTDFGSRALALFERFEETRQEFAREIEWRKQSTKQA